MSFEVQALSSTRQQCVIVYSKEQALGDYQKKLHNMKSKLSVPGFRKGKAPLHMIEKSHGMALMQDLIDQKMNQAWSEIVKNHRVLERPEVAITPAFKTLAELTSDLTITLSFDVAPDFELIAPEKLNITFESVQEPSEEDKIAYRKVLNYQASSSEAVDRPAASGDKIMIDVVYHNTGKDEKGLELILDESQTQKDFIDQMIGMSVGETKRFDYQRQVYQDQEGSVKEDVSVTLQAVFQMIPPSLSDLSRIILDLDRQHGEVTEESVNAWIAQTVRMMNEQKAFKTNEKILVEALDKLYTFEIPSVHTRSMTFESAEHEVRARQQIKMNYILGSYAEKYKINAQQKDVDFFAKIFAQDLGIPLPYLASLLQSNQQIKQRFEDSLVEKSVIAYLISPPKAHVEHQHHVHTEHCQHDH